MCNAIKDGGRRCASHHQASLFMLEYVSGTTGLKKEQVQFLFKNLRSEYRAENTPLSDEQYQGFLAGIKDNLSRRQVRYGDRRKVLQKLEVAIDAENTLSEGNFVAMARLMDSAESTQQEINRAVTAYARREGVSSQEAREKFWGIYERTVTPRSIQGVTPQGMDFRTETALAIFKNIRSEPERETEPRVQYHETSSTMIHRVGYDPADGRLEFHMFRGEPRFFHSVSPEDAEEAVSSPGRILRALEESPAHQYESYSEAVADGYRVRCEHCGQFQAASGHICPAFERTTIGVTEERSLRPLQSIIDEALRVDGVSEEDQNRVQEFFRESRAIVENSPFSGVGEARDVDSASYSGERSSAGNSAHAQYVTVDAEAVAALLSEEVPVQRVWLGRRIAVAGSNGTAFNEATIPYLVKLSNGDAGFVIEPDTDSSPRCTCDNYRENQRCSHLYPENSGNRLNNYVGRDAATGVSNLRSGLQAAGLTPVNPDGGFQVCLSDSPSAAAQEYAVRMIALSSENSSSRVTFPRNLRGVAQQLDAHSIVGLSHQIVRERAQSAVEGYEVDRAARERLMRDIRGSRESVDPAYADNVDEFLEDLRAVRNAGAPTRLSGSVTRGFLSSDGSQSNARGFGIELEFESADRGAVERAMRRAGLDSMLSGYSGRNYSSWQVKTDGSLNSGGEVVSPVLYDNEESWRQIDEVCRILKAHGARVNTRTGAHVHIGSSGFNVEARRGVHIAYASHQDVMYRLATNEERGRHRPGHFSSPFNSNHAEDIYTLNDSNDNVGGGRYRPLNQYNRHTIEFRDFDGTLDSSHIQANVMMAAAVMRSGLEGSAGSRAGSYSGEDRARQVQTIGSSRRRSEELAPRLGRETDEFQVLDNLPVINALDSLFDTREDRRYMLSHIIRSGWQRG